MKINTQQLEKKIGYSFKNKEILLRAMTHSSFAYEKQFEKTSDNEILEFLGDSVLGLIAADYLCDRYPQVSEGELTKLKSAATSTLALYYFSKKIKLDKFIFLGKGEEKSGGRKKKKILAGAFEALIAAIYQDGGIEEARNFLLGLLKTFYRKINAEKFFINNYKSALQEYLQKENLPAPMYKTLTIEGPNHKKTFTIQVFSLGKSLAKAKGNSKKEAEKKAAQKALKSLLGRKLRSLTSDTFLLKKKHD
jgi:ribonuclease-3